MAYAFAALIDHEAFPRAAMKPTNITRLLLIALSLLAGFFVFSASASRSSTLNIDATSLEKGRGTVTFEGQGGQGRSSRTFEINAYPGDQGLKKLYVIELPAVRLLRLRIAPHLGRGNWGVDRVILANDTISYQWDEQGVCRQQMQLPGFHRSEPCGEAGPLIAMDADAAITIVNIPETGFTNPPAARIALALAVAFGVLLCGAWLLRAPLEKRPAHYVVKAAWLGVGLLFVYQLYLVVSYAVDVPTLDEWTAYFKEDGLIHGLSWRWLFGFHNEHLIVMTKLLAWLNLKLFGLNFVLQDIVNFFIFGGVLVALVVFKNRLLGREQLALFPLFMIFLLSPINYENHLWAFQSQFHLTLLFSILMLYHAFHSRPGVGNALAFSLFALLAMCTFSAGVIFVVIYLLAITLYTLAGIRGGRVERAAGWRFLLIICVICGAGLCLWFFGYETIAEPHPKVFPDDARFWLFFLNILSFGFGFKSMHIVPGIVCLAVVLLPLIMLLAKKDTRWSPATWLLLCAVAGILAVLASISLGRAWIYPPKTSRYAEIGFLLIPYSALAWWLAIGEGVRRMLLLALFWLFCCLSYFPDWTTGGHALFRQISLYNLGYLEAYYSGAVPDSAPENATPADMERAKRLKVSFTRQFSPAGGAGRERVVQPSSVGKRPE